MILLNEREQIETLMLLKGVTEADAKTLAVEMRGTTKTMALAFPWGVQAFYVWEKKDSSDQERLVTLS